MLAVLFLCVADGRLVYEAFFTALPAGGFVEPVIHGSRSDWNRSYSLDHIMFQYSFVANETALGVKFINPLSLTYDYGYNQTMPDSNRMFTALSLIPDDLLLASPDPIHSLLFAASLARNFTVEFDFQYYGYYAYQNWHYGSKIYVFIGLSRNRTGTNYGAAFGLSAGVEPENYRPAYQDSIYPGAIGHGIDATTTCFDLSSCTTACVNCFYYFNTSSPPIAHGNKTYSEWIHFRGQVSPDGNLRVTASNATGHYYLFNHAVPFNASQYLVLSDANNATGIGIGFAKTEGRIANFTISTDLPLPTPYPTSAPSVSPTRQPTTAIPSRAPTTGSPSHAPTARPTAGSSQRPTTLPTSAKPPTRAPTPVILHTSSAASHRDNLSLFSAVRDSAARLQRQQREAQRVAIVVSLAGLGLIDVLCGLCVWKYVRRRKRVRLDGVAAAMDTEPEIIIRPRSQSRAVSRPRTLYTINLDTLRPDQYDVVPTSPYHAPFVDDVDDVELTKVYEQCKDKIEIPDYGVLTLSDLYDSDSV